MQEQDAILDDDIREFSLKIQPEVYLFFMALVFRIVLMFVNWFFNLHLLRILVPVAELFVILTPIIGFFRGSFHIRGKDWALTIAFMLFFVGVVASISLLLGGVTRGSMLPVLIHLLFPIGPLLISIRFYFLYKNIKWGQSLLFYPMLGYILLMIIGVQFKIQSWTGASMLVTAAAVWFLLSSLAISIDQLIKHKNKQAIALAALALSWNCLLIGILFKIQSWSSASYLGALGVVLVPCMWIIYGNLQKQVAQNVSLPEE